MEEIEVREPVGAKKREARITELARKIMSAKKGGSGKQTAVPKREKSKKKT